MRHRLSIILCLIASAAALIGCRQESLEKEGFQTVVCLDGKRAIEIFREGGIDLAILDIMMPKADGVTVCREIRKESKMPVIMLTAKGETFDKVLCLDLGADDYIVKPFEGKELVARVKAVLRRTLPEDTENTEKIVSYENITVNLTNYELIINGSSMDIPPKELELLYYLASHPNRVFTREQLLEDVWGFDYYGDSRTVDVHIKRIREKIEGLSEKWTLKTVWSVGYKFEVK